MSKSVFSAADILLPRFEKGSSLWGGWSVIACDQFTSEPEYWAEAEKLSAGQLSALDLVLPEAYLESEKEAEGKARIAAAMTDITTKLDKHSNCMILLERTLPNGAIRRGIVGKIDLEEYDFTADSSSAVRATEETVIERIPPRVAVRESATVELPHIMVFADDRDGDIFAPAFNIKDTLEKIYDFELMLGGGHVCGYKLDGAALEAVCCGIHKYEEKRAGTVVYAVGDGNHSLASAKAHYENIKKSLGEKAAEHPARYALAEIVDLGDSSIVFEPIYRILKNCDPCDVLTSLKTAGVGGGKTECIFDGKREVVDIPALHPLTVGSLQMFIDAYIKDHPQCSCDYIHGVDSLEALSGEKGVIGFLFNGIDKSELFGYVTDHGALPRKTFSMGEAKSKRYYLEAREIV